MARKENASAPAADEAALAAENASAPAADEAAVQNASLEQCNRQLFQMLLGTAQEKE